MSSMGPMNCYVDVAKIVIQSNAQRLGYAFYHNKP
jgi:hypothetical protein